MPTLKATKRELKGRKNYHLRNEGQVPAIIYGAIKDPINVSFVKNELTRILKDVGDSSIIDLDLDGQTLNVLVQDLQFDPLKGTIIHADLRVIDMNKEFEVDIKLNFVGESVAVKGLGGTLVRPLESIAVKCLPKDLPAGFDIDLTKLETFDDAVHVSDLVVPEGVTIVDNPERTLAVVTPPRSDEEMAKLDEAVQEDVGGVEVDGAKEGEEAAEGEEKPAEGEEAKPEEKKEG